MKLKEIGEFGFIRDILEQNLNYADKNVVGIGDDCAVIHTDSENCQIITTDLLVENTHFLMDKISAFDLGHKSLAVNLSDIAAMGGCPSSVFVSLGLPENITVEWLKEFYKGIQKLADESDTMILGGDTTKSKAGLVINIAVLGYMKQENLKLRSTAQASDFICVTGNLGDSAAGLKLILNGDAPSNPDQQKLIEMHNKPRPHLQEGQWLAQFKAIHAMMDVSDGIDSDLKRIIEQSNVGATINLDALPTSKSLSEIAEEQSWNIYELAAAGGEDYCLLCTVDSSAYAEINQKFNAKFGHDLYKIGHATEALEIIYLINNKIVTLNQKGYDHFG